MKIGILLLSAFISIFGQNTLSFSSFFTEDRMGMYGLNQEVRSIAVSPENKFAYVLSGQKYNTGSTALGIFSIDSSAGTLKFVGCYPLDKRFLNKTTSTTISPDGKNLFITHSTGLDVYRRDELSGLLSFLQYFENGKDGVSGLNQAAKVAVSADNKNVYIASNNEYDASIAVFERNTTTGTLTFTTSISDGVDAVQGIHRAKDIVVSPDDKTVYVLADSLVVFNRNVSSRALSFSSCSSYKSQQTIDGGFLTIVAVNKLLVSTDNEYVYLCCSGYEFVNENSLSPTIIKILKNENNAGMLTTIANVRVTGDQESVGAYGTSMVLSTDNKSLFVIGAPDSSVTVFNRDLATGLLTFNSSINKGNNGSAVLSNIKCAVTSRDGNSIYIGASYEEWIDPQNWIGGAITILNRNSTTGTLNFGTSFKNSSNTSIDGLTNISAITVSPDNKNVYMTSAGDTGITIYNRDITTGELTFGSIIKNDNNGVTGLRMAKSIVVSPDNKNVYVASSADGAIAVFTRNTLTGVLTFSTCIKNGENGVVGLKYAYCVAISPDSKNVYVSGADDSAIVIFTRDQSTGALTYSSTLKNGTGGIDGMIRPISITVSPDNLNLYVVSVSDSSIVVFNRDVSTGMLTYNSHLKNGKDGVVGLCGVRAVTISPDNQNVYVASWRDSTISAFNRNVSTGALTYSSFFKEGRNGVVGLGQPMDIIVGPDSKNVYVASSKDSALTVFSRNSISGELTYDTCFRAVYDGIAGLCSAQSLFVSPDNKNVIVGGIKGIANFNINIAAITPIAKHGSVTPVQHKISLVTSNINKLQVVRFTTSAPGIADISLFNVQGKCVKRLFRKTVESGEHNAAVNISDIATGTYLLRLLNGKEHVVSTLVIVK